MVCFLMSQPFIGHFKFIPKIKLITKCILIKKLITILVMYCLMCQNYSLLVFILLLLKVHVATRKNVVLTCKLLIRLNYLSDFDTF